MNVHIRESDDSVINPTNHMAQIKMDFHCFDSSTAIGRL